MFLAFTALLHAAPVNAQSAFEDPGTATGAAAVGGGLVAVNPDMNGGTVIVGSTAQVVALFRNDGAKPVTVGAINLYPSSGISASVGLNQCAQEPLESGAICAIALSVKGLQPGQYRLETLIRHDGKTKLLNSIITGNVESTGDATSDLINDIEAVPTEITFDSVSSSRPQVRSIILRNVTSKKVDINEMFIEASPQSGFTLNSDCTTLEAGQACLASVTWTPTQEGADSGVLVLRHSGPAAITSVGINGQYQPSAPTAAQVFPSAVPGKGLLVSSQTEVNFGSISSASSITVSLVNVGDAPLTISSIRMSNEETGISISPKGCGGGTVLDPIEACALTLEWEPTKTGSVFDDIQIFHSGARGILVLPLRGDASQAVNKDSKAIVLSDVMSEQGLLRSIPALSADDLGGVDAPDTGEKTAKADNKSEDEEDDRPVSPPKPSVPDVTGVLDGFAITSLAPDRAIIAGPGGSRVIYTGEEAVIGGVLWNVFVRSSSVEFSSGGQQVLLLFDKSLSSVNRNTGQSNSIVTNEDAPVAATEN